MSAPRAWPSAKAFGENQLTECRLKPVSSVGGPQGYHGSPGERAPRVHPVRLDDDVGVDQYRTLVACHVALQIDRLLDAVHSEQLRQILDGSVEQHGHAPDGDMAAVQGQAHHLHELFGEPR